jgi:hypothetical protein
MLVYFRGQWRLGGAAVLVGALAAVALVRSVRGFNERRATDDGRDDNA